MINCNCQEKNKIEDEESEEVENYEHLGHMITSKEGIKCRVKSAW